MTKCYDPNDPKNKPKENSALADALEEFPSPPKKDGTADPENILAKKRRERMEESVKKAYGGGKKGANKPGHKPPSSSGGEKKG